MRRHPILIGTTIDDWWIKIDPLRCNVCARAKMTKDKKTWKGRNRKDRKAKFPFEAMCCDTCVPNEKEGLFGERYYFIACCVLTSYHFIYHMKLKSEIPDALIALIHHVVTKFRTP